MRDIAMRDVEDKMTVAEKQTDIAGFEAETMT